MLRRPTLTAVIAVLACACACASGAASAAPAAGATHHGLAVEPGSVLHAAQPGSSFTVSLVLSNTTATALHVQTGAIAARGARNGEALVEADAKAAHDPARNAAGWLSFPARTIDIAPGQDANVVVHVHVPASARPGVHGVLATFSVPTTAAGSGGAGVSGKAGIGAALLFEVPGHAAAAARIVHAQGPHTIRSGHAGTFTALVENTGDTLLRVDGQVRLDAPWAAARVLGTNEQLALPGGRRRLAMRYDDPPLIGRYTPQLTVVGGAGSGVRITTDLHPVWVLPPWWLVAALIAAIALAVASVRSRRRRRRPSD